MPLATNDISFANIQIEFGGTNPISLNEYYAGGSFIPAGATGVNGVVPASGAISCLDLAGVELLFVYAGYFVDDGTQNITSPVAAMNSDGNVFVSSSLPWTAFGGATSLMLTCFDTDGTILYSIRSLFTNTGQTPIPKSCIIDSQGNAVTCGHITGGARSNVFTSISSTTSSTLARRIISHSTYGMEGGFMTKNSVGTSFIAVETSAPNNRPGIAVIATNGDIISSSSDIFWAKQYNYPAGSPYQYKIRSIDYINNSSEILLVFTVLGIPTSTGVTNNKAVYILRINASNGLLNHADEIDVGGTPGPGVISYRELDFVARASNNGNSNFFVNGIRYLTNYDPAREEYFHGYVQNLGNDNDWFNTNNGNGYYGRFQQDWNEPSPSTFDYEAKVHGVFQISTGETLYISSMKEPPALARRRLLFTSINNSTFEALYNYYATNHDATDNDIELNGSGSVFQQVGKRTTIGYAAITKSASSTTNKLIVKILPRFTTYPDPDTVTYGRYGANLPLSPTYDRLQYKSRLGDIGARSFGVSTINGLSVLTIPTTDFTINSPGGVTGNTNDVTKTLIHPNGNWPNIVSFSPGQGEIVQKAITFQILTQNVTLTFDEPIFKGTGSLIVRRLQPTSGSITDTINVATDPRVTISGGTVTISNVNLDFYDDEYYIEFPPGCFKDSDNNNWAGERYYYFKVVEI